MLPGTLLLVFLSLTAAQVSRRCSCISKNDCEQAKQVHFECPSPYEVCCEQSVSPVQSTSLPAKQPGVCGLRGKRSQVRPRVRPQLEYKITDGDGGDISTYYGEFPWMVAIMKVDQSGNQVFLCAGTIIYPNIILTSAHFFSNLNAGDLRVKAGIWNNADAAETNMHQDRTVLRTVLHPGFVRETAANDVALLILNQRLNIADNVAPICLPTSDTAINTANCIATGWGSDNLFNRTIQSVLKQVKLPMVDSGACQRKMREYFGPDFELESSSLCAGGSSLDTCLGDGGGPLMCATTANENQFVQVGITSWGVVGCAQGYPGAYASVQVLANWIESQSRIYRTNIKPSTNRLDD